MNNNNKDRRGNNKYPMFIDSNCHRIMTQHNNKHMNKQKRKRKRKRKRNKIIIQRLKILPDCTMKHNHTIQNERGCSSDGRAFP